jgi:CRISPR/Cas system CMR subunit Cmr6 (Cas7 group RAMP superfamily)
VTNDSTTENNIGKRQSEGEQEVDNETEIKYTGRQSKRRRRETGQLRKAVPNTSNSTAITGMSNSHIYQVMIMLMIITTMPYSLT